MEDKFFKRTWFGFKIFFVDEYHYLKLNQKLGVGYTGYYSMGAVVHTTGIASTLNNIVLIATSD